MAKVKVDRGIQILCFAFTVSAFTVSAWAESEEQGSELMATRYQFTEPQMLIDSIKNKMQMDQKGVCPFGYPQLDEDILAQAAKQRKEQESTWGQDRKGQVSLDEIVKQIPVNAVFSKRGVFFSGKRIVRKGQTLKVMYQSKTYDVLVSQIGSGGIVFKDVEGDQQAIKKLNVASRRIKRKYEGSKLRQQLNGFSNSQNPLQIGGGNSINLRK